MNTKPKISIIVPIYNVEKYLVRCLDSIVNQTLKEIEIILVDDGSPDKCPQICDDYASKDCRIKTIHKKNEGLGFARNSGLEIATGEYVAFVDSDDYIKNNMYECLYDNTTIDKYDAVYCGFYVEKNDGSKYSENMKDRIFNNKKDVLTFCKNMIASDVGIKTERTESMAVWHAIYKREILEKYKIRFDSEREILSEDIVFDLKFLPLCNMVRTIPDILYVHCYNDQSLSNTFNECKIDRNVSLYYRLIDIASIYKLNDWTLNIMRFFIGYSRSLLKSIMTSNLSIISKKQLSERIYNMSVLKEVLKTYPVYRMSISQQLMIFLITNKMFYTSYILFKILKFVKYV